MPANLSCGISVTDDLAHFVILKIIDSKSELVYLDEYKRTELDTNDVWFLKSITTRSESISEKPKSISVALDKKMLFICSFPMDSMLNKEQQNEHLNWELSQLIPSYHSKDYISDTHLLQTHVEGKKDEFLSVTIKRSLINQIHEYTAHNDLSLNIVDAAHFSAGETLLHSHPEIRTQNCSLVGLSRSQMEYSFYKDGHLSLYNYRPETNIEFVLQYLKYVLREQNSDLMFIYGPNATLDLLHTLRTEISPQINILNPFSRLSVASSVRNFERYSNITQRFASAVGIALRKS